MMRQRRRDDEVNPPAEASKRAAAPPPVTQLLTLQRSAGNHAVGRMLQRAFFYDFKSDQIRNNRYNDDEYYSKLEGFDQFESADGVKVWADSRNGERVSQLTVSGGLPGVKGRPLKRPDPVSVINTIPPLISSALAVISEPPQERIEQPSETPKERAVHVATMVVPTHDNGWQARTSFPDRIKLLENALKDARERWGKLDPNALYVFLAPEYLFAEPSKKTHSMSGDDHAKALLELDKIASGLEPNILFVPGTIGWTKPIKDLVESDVRPQQGAKVGSQQPQSPLLKAPLDELALRHKTLLGLLNQVGSDLEGKELEDSWSVESKDLNEHATKELKKDEKREDPKALFNRAYLYFNGARDHYDKMVESTSMGATDRLGGDTNTAFFHGDTPFAKEYLNIRVGLEICSDLASNVSQMLKQPPTLQLAPTSKYGSGGASVSGELLVIADSFNTTLATKDEQYPEPEVKGNVRFHTTKLPTTTKLN